ncbi:MAG TPA: multifunctional oxoglutarate decarboxylase/oxoglutarate dehydrogenase thiamine pyrophosphate-binding subunit/dihydrolipoyllysine-residue succinyltransferase subunit [Acidimicrobiales bacterium]|nr:multifunctional oxoglutarate decarboxylase/oxoglutarate dehydrogenase thiamine pyrophosphate-binding subunit/dihydrolipoyllysine-residue succinyltransferase subunit [Acidimicrobiales bacterium]
MSSPTEKSDDGRWLGPNAWLVDEMYERYRDNPSSVSESWQEFFADYHHRGLVATRPEPAVAGSAPAPDSTTAVAAAPVLRPTPPAPRPATADAGTRRAAEALVDGAAGTTNGSAASSVPLRGAAARIAASMEASLAIPTATSVRVVPAGLLEVNRRILNNQLARVGAGKVSVTHVIGYAVVKALQALPVMNSSFVPASAGGAPSVIRHPHVGLGLAVDQKKSDGSRTLLVPVIKEADTLDFRRYWAAYEELIRKIKTGKIGPDDFAGASVTLTNPGTIGTVASVPRLMPGQGLIVAVGSLDYPAEWQAADPRTVAALGLSKVMTITSTYDHRIIQGAESGLFLAQMHRYLIGEDGFYDDIFRAMGIPYEPVRWLRDINDPSGLDAGNGSQTQKQIHVQTLINMYRVRGHLIAHLDPLDWREPHLHSELNPTTYGLTLWDLEREFLTDGLAGQQSMRLSDILSVLRDAYCRTVGVEYMHIQEPDQKRWIQEHVEGVSLQMTPEEHRHILLRLNAAEALERFLDTKYIGQKRFGLEGAESAIPLLDAVLDRAAVEGIGGAVLGMAHRGRLNVLINIVGKSYRELFEEFEGNLDPDTTQGSGDVKYHKGYHGTFTGLSGQPIDVHLSSNPSHLEAVDPVVEGMARAYQDLSGTGSVLPVLVHGDAAFAGQGVVAETLNMSALEGYATGGTVHLVINNQLGFTTNPESARSSVYATDVAKMVQAPIFHVNGDDPEACVRVARLAFEFRQAFHKDVVIDLVCYRRFGHNEQDDPSLTQPRMYDLIKVHRSVRKIYTETLVRRGDITMDEAEAALKDFSLRLQAALDETRASAPPKPMRLPARLAPAPVLPPFDTGVPIETLDRLASALHNPPEGFTVHPKLVRVFDNRAKLWAGGEADWALGEALAYGSLLVEGHDVRLAGQDTRRGTFGHRNAALIDVNTGAEWIPLQHLESIPAAGAAPAPAPGRFFVYDSLLSEYAALGFEYGYSVVQQDALVAWEAQFGDFVNGGQIIIDQFLVASKAKWGQTCGLTLLLPHGYEGQGAEHSSARVERFLQLCAEDNIQVANPTTSAQLFHLLRRQTVRAAKRPLVLLTPKKYLRAREAYSRAEEFATGSFREVIDDQTIADPSSVRRVVLASGKMALDLMSHRVRTGGPSDVAIIRVEQVYPWPEEQLRAAIGRYPDTAEVVWAQEEPENMGAWWFARGKLQRTLGSSSRISSVARLPSGSPATGSAALSALEAEDLTARAFGRG